MVHSVVTDLTITFSPTHQPAPDDVLSLPVWQRLEKDLYLHSVRQSTWLQVAQAEETKLTTDDVVVIDIKISEDNPTSAGSAGSWESRPGGIWLLRSNYTAGGHKAVTGVDVLFGTDAVDPRPQWTLKQPPIHLEQQSQEPVPVPRLTVRHGRAEPRTEPAKLRIREDGTFKIVQISDTHMVTGVGVCKDSIDADGRLLPESEADPQTVIFMGQILDIEKPDLVILTGDQLHHDILDSQSTLFKVVAPLIERSIPYATVFGNHDDEGSYALSHK
jgi:calcineurin-like phosphoesterase family protein